MKLTSRGNKPAKNYAYRRHMAALVRVRWERNGYRCEGCDVPTEVVECAHLFGRRNVISRSPLRVIRRCAPPSVGTAIERSTATGTLC